MEASFLEEVAASLVREFLSKKVKDNKNKKLCDLALESTACALYDALGRGKNSNAFC